ncbi:hypothetical protein, partial [Vibrio mimicus]|uniref:hypothetical protein n=1 Tax=Vibrio mimicus TaxID=674 RepID=UPI002FEF3B1A
NPSQSSSIKQILKPAENAGFLLPKKLHNARLRGWQRTTLNLNIPTVTTAAQWDWKRNALTVPLEAFVSLDTSS